MLKQPTVVRELVVSDVDKLSRHLHAMLTLREPIEIDALTALEDPQRQGFVVAVSDFVLACFGQPASTAVTPRFSKTYRAATKLAGKGLRGEPRPKRVEPKAPTVPVAASNGHSPP